MGKFAPKAKIIHIDIDTAAISKNVTVDVPVVADAKVALEALVEIAKNHGRIKSADAFYQEIKQWENEHPLIMEDSPKGVNPQTVIETANELMPDAIVVTDVWTASDVGNPVYLYDASKTSASDIRRSWNDGLWTSCFHWRGNVPSGSESYLLYRRRGRTDEHSGNGNAVQQETPIIICIFNNSLWEWCVSSRNCSMVNVMQVPVCRREDPAHTLAKDRVISVRHIHRIL